MEEPRQQGIYSIVNVVNGMQYIGSSVNISSRFYQHVWELQKGIHHNSYLQNAFVKYSEASFEFVKKTLSCLEEANGY